MYPLLPPHLIKFILMYGTFSNFHIQKKKPKRTRALMKSSRRACIEKVETEPTASRVFHSALKQRSGLQTYIRISRLQDRRFLILEVCHVTCPAGNWCEK